MTDRTNQEKSADVKSDAAEHEDTVRKGYEAALQPERQGDGDPGTEPVEGETHPDASPERATGTEEP